MASIINWIASFFAMAESEPVGIYDLSDETEVIRHYDFSSDKIYERGPFKICVKFSSNWTNDKSFIRQIDRDIRSACPTTDNELNIENVYLDFTQVAVNVLDLFQFMDKLKNCFKLTEFLRVEVGGLVRKKRKRDDSYIKCIESLTTNKDAFLPRLKDVWLTIHGCESCHTHPILFVNALACICSRRSAKLEVREPPSRFKMPNLLILRDDGELTIDMNSDYHGIHILDLAMGFHKTGIIKSILLGFGYDYHRTVDKPIQYINPKFVKKLDNFLEMIQELEIPELKFYWGVDDDFPYNRERLWNAMNCVIKYQNKISTRAGNKRLLIDIVKSEEGFDPMQLRQVLNCGANDVDLKFKELKDEQYAQAFVNGFKFGKNLTKIQIFQENKWQDFLLPAMEGLPRRPWELALAFPAASDVTDFMVKLSHFDSGVKYIDICNHNLFKVSSHDPKQIFSDGMFDKILSAVNDMPYLEKIQRDYYFSEWGEDLFLTPEETRKKKLWRQVKIAKYGVLSKFFSEWGDVERKINIHIESEFDETFKANLFFECFQKFGIQNCLIWANVEEKAAKQWFPKLKRKHESYCF